MTLLLLLQGCSRKRMAENDNRSRESHGKYQE